MKKLAELADVTVGFVGTMTPHYRESGVPFLRSQNVTPHAVDLADLKFIDPDFDQTIQKSALSPGDVVIVRTGKPGTAAVIPASVERANCADLVVVRPGPELNSRWFSYFMNSVARHAVSANTVGAVHQHFNVGAAKALELPDVSLCEQERVAEVLGALDDKIAANRRVIDASDSLVRVLYSSTPKTPQGRTFADIADIGGGGTPSTKNPDYWDGGVGWATPTDVTGADGPWLARTTRSISEEGLRNCSSPLYPKGSILTTSRATIGAVVVARKPMAVNQGFIVLNAVEPEMQWWIESQVRARTAEFETWANGATFLEISRGTFKKLPVLECSSEDLDKFNETAQAVRDRQWASQDENEKLTRTRDELLPLLMSGRISVRDAERTVEDVL